MEQSTINIFLWSDGFSIYTEMSCVLNKKQKWVTCYNVFFYYQGKFIFQENLFTVLSRNLNEDLFLLIWNVDTESNIVNQNQGKHKFVSFKYSFFIGNIQYFDLISQLSIIFLTTIIMKFLLKLINEYKQIIIFFIKKN